MLYTIKNAFATHHIKRGGHLIYFEEYGNPKGIPVIFLHGGPGSGCSDSQKSIFNKKKHRVIFLDQRGSGRSTPKGRLKENTTNYLIQDIDYIRDVLKECLHKSSANIFFWGGVRGQCDPLMRF